MNMRCIRALIAALGAALTSSISLHAQTWDGGGADNNWTTVLNWSPDVAPANNGTANIIFGGLVRLTPSVNIAQDILSLTFNNTAGAFTLSGTTLTTRGGGITNNDADTQTINAPIVLQANQVWSAASGPLVFGGATISGGGTGFDLTIDGIFDTTISSAISGTGTTLTKNGSGTLNVSGANVHSSGTTVNAGTLRLLASNTISDFGGITLNGTAVFDLNGFTETTSALTAAAGTTISLPTTSFYTVNGGTITGVISGASTATFRKFGGGTLSIGGNNTFAGTIRISQDTLLIQSSERVANTADLLLDAGTAAFNVQTFTETVDVVTLQSGSLSGTSGTLIANAFNVESGFITAHLAGPATLTKSTAGTVSVTNTNTYTGATNVTAGVLLLGINNTLPFNTSSVFVADGATLQILGGTTQSIATLGGAGEVIFGANASLSVGGGNDTSIFSGIISGAGMLNKSGTGTFMLNGANTYSAGTAIHGGSLILGDNNVLPDTNIATVNAPGTLDMLSYSETIGELSLKGGSIIGTGTLNAGAFNVESGTVSATLVGSAALTKTAAGTVTLTNANTYTGGTNVNAGVLEISSDSNLGALGGGLSFNGGTLRTTGSLSSNRTVTMSAVGGTIETLGITTLGGSIRGTGMLTKIGAGTLFLNGINPSLAALAVNAGDLNLPVGGQLNVSGTATVGTNGFFASDGGLITAGTFSNSGEIDLLHDARLVGPMNNSGVLDGDGRITGALTNAASGDVIVSSGELLHLAGPASHSNAGCVEVIGGELKFDAPLTNVASTGMIYARNSSLRFNGGLTNAGSIGLSFGIRDLTGDISNLVGGSIVISGGSSATFVDDVANSGTVQVSAGASGVFFGAVTGGGSFPGTGTVFLEGDLQPGASPAQVNFGGDLNFGSESSLQIEIGGTTPGTQHDTLVIADQVSLDGALIVTLINGFQPSIRDTFQIVTAGSRSGQFSSVQLPPLPNGLFFVVEYSPTSVRLIVSGPGMFVGAPGGSWFVASNWGGGSVPNATTDVFIPVEVHIDDFNAAAMNVTIKSGGMLIVGDVGGASLDVTSTVTVRSGGALTIAPQGTLAAADIIVNGGGVLHLVSPSAMLRAQNITIQEGATINWTAGTIEIDGGTWNNPAATTLMVGCTPGSSATLVVKDGAVVFADEIDICADGEVRGNGTLAANVTNAGTLSPGLGAGILHVAGGYIQIVDGELRLELGGFLPQIEHDVLDITDGATLGGSVHIVLINGFESLCGDEFQVINAGAVSGTFANVVGPSGLCGSVFESQYSANLVTLAVIPAPGSPDLNCDEVVGVPDLLGVINGWGLCPPDPCDCRADVNDDGTVGVPDLLQVINNWG